MSDVVHDTPTSDLRMIYPLPMPTSNHTMVIVSNKFGPGKHGVALLVHAPNHFQVLVMPEGVDVTANVFKDGHPFQKVWTAGLQEADLQWVIYWIENAEATEIGKYLHNQGYQYWKVANNPWQELLIRTLFMSLEPRFIEGLSADNKTPYAAGNVMGNPARFMDM